MKMQILKFLNAYLSIIDDSIVNEDDMYFDIEELKELIERLQKPNVIIFN